VPECFSEDEMRLSQRVLALGALPLVFLCCPTTANADGPVQISGGLSPNGKLAIVVKRDEDTSQASVSSDNVHPMLENMVAKRIIGPLEEVDTFGGGFSHVLGNLTAYWSADNHFVAIRFRAGRLSQEIIVYLIKSHGAGYRAVPQKLPEATSGPNGLKIFAHASHAANMGDIFERWLSPTELALREYRYFPPYPPDSADVDFFNGDGVIEVDYSYGPSGWIVSGYKKPPEPVTN
jgi:hypothetical protein